MIEPCALPPLMVTPLPGVILRSESDEIAVSMLCRVNSGAFARADDSSQGDELDTGNVPMAVIPESVDEAANAVDDSYTEPLFAPASDASNAPVAEAEPEPEPARNLDEIREELQRRNEE